MPKRIYLLLILCLTFISPGFTMSSPSYEPLLVFDNLSFKVALRNFRSPQWDLDTPPMKYVEGVSNLNASASGQFSQAPLLRTFDGRDHSKIWIVDLRMESHGFVDGQAISWYGNRNIHNKNLSLDDILKREQQYLKHVESQDTLEVAYILHKSGGVIKQTRMETVTPKLVETEQQLTNRLGFNYLRLPILDRHPPAYDAIDTFLTFLDTLPKDAWLHFHCRAGKGRATTMMVLYDIIKNGTTMSVDQILDRQSYFGPKDLRKMPTRPEDLWKLEPAKERLQLVKDFHTYRNSPEFGKVTWSGWKRMQA